MSGFIPEARTQAHVPICNAIEAEDFKQALKLVDKRLAKSNDSYLVVSSSKGAGRIAALRPSVTGSDLVAAPIPRSKSHPGIFCPNTSINHQDQDGRHNHQC